MPEPVVTRVEFKGAVPRRRSLDDRLAVRFPWLGRAVIRSGMRIFSPGSRIRRAGLRRSIRSGWAASARKDWELMLTRYSPDVVWEIPEEFQTLGFAASYRGHGGMVEGLDQFAEAFEWWEVRPDRALDLGDRILTLGQFHGKARASGVEWRQQFAQLVAIERGLVEHERFFYSWEQGLEAAGLDPRFSDPGGGYSGGAVSKSGGSDG